MRVNTWKGVMGQDKRLLSVGETAARFGVSPWTVRDWIAQRKLTRVKIGRRVLVPESEIERVIERGTQPARTV
jgi:excisionase family DNA binding protein